jgi:hypothetical protein
MSLNTDDDYDQIMEKYINLMNEIKIRTDTINSFIGGEKTLNYKYLDVEYTCLQFRKIFELIALANMVTNQDAYMRQYVKFRDHYHAERILRDIEKINPNFYPTPMKPISEPHAQADAEPINVDSVDGDHLTKEEFIEAYDTCSELLHAENPFAPPKDLEGIQGKFKGWLQKTVNLLSFHSIQLTNSDRQLWVLMRSSEDDSVNVTLMSKVGGAE